MQESVDCPAGINKILYLSLYAYLCTLLDTNSLCTNVALYAWLLIVSVCSDITMISFRILAFLS